MHLRGYEYATLQTTIHIQEHSTTKNFPYIPISASLPSYSVWVLPWLSPPLHCGLVYHTVACQSLCEDAVASPAGLSRHGTCPLTLLYAVSYTGPQQTMQLNVINTTHAFRDERAEMWQHLIQARIRCQTVQSFLQNTSYVSIQ